MQFLISSIQCILLKPYVERVLQECGTGDSQEDVEPKEVEAEEDELDMMVTPLQNPQEATPTPAHVDGEEPIRADNPRDNGEAVEPLVEADEQAQGVALPADNIRRSTRQRRPPERLGTWVYY